MTGRLGCGEYSVVVRRTGEDGAVGPVIEVFDNVTAVRWTKQLNRIGTNSVSIGGFCCGPLTDFVQKSYCDPGEVSITRTPEGNEVAVGPLTAPVFGDETATLGFSDLMWWATGKALGPYDYSGAPADLTTVLEDGYAAAFDRGDPSVLDFIKGLGTGQFVNPQVGTYRLLSDQIQDLQRQGLQYVQSGRELRAGPQIPDDAGIAEIRLGKIDDDDVVGEMQFARRWDLAANRVIVQGADGVFAVAEDPNCPSRTARDLILNEPEMTQQEAQVLADSQLALRSPAPMVITMPSGAWLSPDSELCVDDLIPGALVPVCSDNACFEGEQLMQIVKVEGRKSGNGDEQIRLQFATPGSGSLNLGFDDDPFRAVGRELANLRREVSRLRRQNLG